MKYPTLINNPKLTTDMFLTRSGSTQLFRRDYKDREFTDKENADVVLTPPEKHVYAKLIDNEWNWVNGCNECNGEERRWYSNGKCTKHDVCQVCKTPRANIKGIPWGHPKGIICIKCRDNQHNLEKQKSLDAMTDKEYDSFDYHSLSRPKCPHCDFEMEDYFEYYDAESSVYECARCDNEYIMTPNHEVTFTTDKIDK